MACPDYTCEEGSSADEKLSLSSLPLQSSSKSASSASCLSAGSWVSGRARNPYSFLLPDHHHHTMPPPPPPPPPPICFPFTSNKNKPRRRLSWSSSERSAPHGQQMHRPQDAHRGERTRSPSFDSYAGGGAAESITFHSDSEKYDDLPELYVAPEKTKPKLGRGNSLSLGGLTRGNTITGTKKSTASGKWGGWGRNRGGQDVPRQANIEEHEEPAPLPIYKGPIRQNSRSTQASRSTQRTQDSERTMTSALTGRESRRSNSSRSTAPRPRPPLMAQDSTSTLVGSAFERKVNDRGSIREKPDTTERVEELRRLMEKDNLDY